MSQQFQPDMTGIVDRGTNATVDVWYHGSPVPLPVGTVLEAGHGRNFDESSADEVSISSEMSYAWLWAAEAAGVGATAYVYEVEALAPIRPWRVGPKNYGEDTAFFEARTVQARITGVAREMTVASHMVSKKRRAPR